MDFVTKTKSGKIKVYESKKGPTARQSKPQKEMQKVVKSGGSVIPKGKNAKKAGFEPKKPMKVDEYQLDRW